MVYLYVVRTDRGWEPMTRLRAHRLDQTAALNIYPWRAASGRIVVNRLYTGPGVARHDAHQLACAHGGGAPPRRRCLQAKHF
jgi:hypothetical protein